MGGAVLGGEGRGAGGAAAGTVAVSGRGVWSTPRRCRGLYVGVSRTAYSGLTAAYSGLTAAYSGITAA